jgi:Ca2+-binding EF-hand superfamily protein
MSARTIQQERLDKRFELWDANGDGRIDGSDFEAEARRILRSFNEPETTPKGRAVLAAYQNMWMIATVRGDIDANGSIDPVEFKRIGTEAVIESGPAGFAEVLQPCIAAVADLCDEDDDGLVDRAEFARWLNAVGVQEDPGELFNRLDTNGTGTLSKDELIQAVRDYHEGKLDVPLLGR